MSELEEVEVVEGEIVEDDETAEWEYTPLSGGYRLRHHPRHQCLGEWCAIHKPMPGPWELWPMLWNQNLSSIDRLCPHGVAHPAAEQYGFWGTLNQDWRSAHTCDGCPCAPEWGRSDPNQIIRIVGVDAAARIDEFLADPSTGVRRERPEIGQ